MGPMASMFASAGQATAARVASPRVVSTLDVICAGEALRDLAPPGGTLLRFRPGGGAVNAAVALARSGLRVGLAAALGDSAPAGRSSRTLRRLASTFGPCRAAPRRTTSRGFTGAAASLHS